MIQNVSNRLLREFSECLQKSIEAPAAPAAAPGDGAPGEAHPAPAAKPIGGISLALGALWDRIRRLFRRER